MLDDEIQETLSRQNLPVLPAVLEALRVRETELAAVSQIQYTPEAKAKHIEAIDTKATTAAEVALAAAVDADGELRQLRAERDAVTRQAAGTALEDWEPGVAKAFPDMHDHMESLAARRLGTARAAAAIELPARLAEVQALSDPAGLATAFEEAALAGHTSVTRTVGRVVAEKLKALEQERNGTLRAPAVLAASAFRRRFGEWQTAHPSELDQVQRLDDRIAARDRQLRSSASWTLRFGGLGK